MREDLIINIKQKTLPTTNEFRTASAFRGSDPATTTTAFSSRPPVTTLSVNMAPFLAPIHWSFPVFICHNSLPSVFTYRPKRSFCSSSPQTMVRRRTPPPFGIRTGAMWWTLLVGCRHRTCASNTLTNTIMPVSILITVDTLQFSYSFVRPERIALENLQNAELHRFAIFNY